jgi:hypothetical protein
LGESLLALRDFRFFWFICGTKKGLFAADKYANLVAANRQPLDFGFQIESQMASNPQSPI